LLLRHLKCLLFFKFSNFKLFASLIIQTSLFDIIAAQ
jgi:hypothetical protein